MLGFLLVPFSNSQRKFTKLHFQQPEVSGIQSWKKEQNSCPTEGTKVESWLPNTKAPHVPCGYLDAQQLTPSEDTVLIVDGTIKICRE